MYDDLKPFFEKLYTTHTAIARLKYETELIRARKQLNRDLDEHQLEFEVIGTCEYCGQTVFNTIYDQGKFDSIECMEAHARGDKYEEFTNE